MRSGWFDFSESTLLPSPPPSLPPPSLHSDQNIYLSTPPSLPPSSYPSLPPSLLQVFDFNRRTCLGSGKVSQIKAAMAGLDCKTVIIDEELSPSQQMNLETTFGGEKANIKVLDRTALILDIFAQHAKSKEGKLQVCCFLPSLLPPAFPPILSSDIVHSPLPPSLPPFLPS